MKRDFSIFQDEFLTMLHSKDKELGSYRIESETILINIFIALTGIGLLLIAAYLIYSKLTVGRALLCFQKSKTTSEEIIVNIEKELNNLSLTT